MKTFEIYSPKIASAPAGGVAMNQTGDTMNTISRKLMSAIFFATVVLGSAGAVIIGTAVASADQALSPARDNILEDRLPYASPMHAVPDK